MLDIRPMGKADVVDAEAAWDRTYRALLLEQHLPVRDRSPEMIENHQRRMTHLLETDPQGSWVADVDGTIIGVAQAHIRHDRWVLATLGVAPERQERGIGRALLERTLDYGRRAAFGAIFSSPDPRAVHRYASAGFDLHPTFVGFGQPRKHLDAPAGISDGTTGGLEVVNAVDRAVRGTERTTDLAFQLNNGYELLLADDHGYAVVQGGQLAMLAALDESSAARLLSCAIARCPLDKPFNVSWITARQQWAVPVLVSAGVPLFVHEAVMTRGAWEPRLPYLPNGIFG